MSHIEYQPDIFVYTDDTTGQNDDALNPVKPLKGIVIRCTNGDFLMVRYTIYEGIEEGELQPVYEHSDPSNFDETNFQKDPTQSPWVLM